MRTNIRYIQFWTCLVLLLCLATVSAWAEQLPPPLRVLCIGNSFSGNATDYLPMLGKAAGIEIQVAQASFGGASLEQHWQKAQAASQNPVPDKAFYSKKRTLPDWFKAEPWDVVTIQQASVLSHDVNNAKPYAGLLVAMIGEHAPQARVLVHQTWAYRADHPRFTKPEPDSPHPTQAVMYEKLRLAYQQIAKELQLNIIPVGDAFFAADSHPEYGFRPLLKVDAADFQHPALPAQNYSLHVGWKWQKNKDDTYRMGYDGNHASQAGKYLAACVWMETLTAKDVTTLEWIPPGLDAQYAGFLR